MPAVCPSPVTIETKIRPEHYSTHRLRIRILWTLEVPEIQEFLRILKLWILKLIKFKLSYSSPPSSNKIVANTALNFWIKSSVMSTLQMQDTLTRQQFSMHIKCRAHKVTVKHQCSLLFHWRCFAVFRSAQTFFSARKSLSVHAKISIISSYLKIVKCYLAIKCR